MTIDRAMTGIETTEIIETEEMIDTRDMEGIEIEIESTEGMTTGTLLKAREMAADPEAGQAVEMKEDTLTGETEEIIDDLGIGNEVVVEEEVVVEVEGIEVSAIGARKLSNTKMMATRTLN